MIDPPAHEPSTAAKAEPPEDSSAWTSQMRRRVGSTQRRLKASSAGNLWQRLTSFDFITQAMIFAAVLLLCFFPFLIVLDALAGRDNTVVLHRWLGLNQQATADVNRLFTSDKTTRGAVTGASYVFFILGGYAATTALQTLYERVYNLQSRGMRDVWRRLGWLILLLGATVLTGWGSHAVRDAGDLPYAVASLLYGSVVFWFTMWFLLSGRVKGAYLLPGAIASGLYWMGMLIVFRHVFSGIVISDYDKYGTIGAVFAFMSFFIAIGVVVVLGAITGVVWRERELSWSGALARLRRKPSTVDTSSDDVVAPEEH